nr:UPF0389 protein CG9231 isoform X1 [Leptinotarsa decemlineata]
MMFSYLSNILGRKDYLSSTKYKEIFRFEHDAGKIDSSHKVNNLEKRFLVWTGKYKNINEVPAYVTQSVMERARNRMRIRIANYMMLGTVLGCIAMVYLGKQDAKRGESVAKQNLDWHARINAEAREKEKMSQQ